MEKKKKLPIFFMKSQFKSDNDLVRRIYLTDSLKGDIVIKGINPHFSECLMPLELVISWEDCEIAGSLLMGDLPTLKDNDTTIYSFWEYFNPSCKNLEDILGEFLIQNENNRKEILLDYLLRKDFMLFLSTGSYVEDMILANEIYQKYWLGKDVKEEDMYSNSGVGRLLARTSFSLEKDCQEEKEKKKEDNKKMRVEPTRRKTCCQEEKKKGSQCAKIDEKELSDDFYKKFNDLLDTMIDNLKNNL